MQEREYPDPLRQKNSPEHRLQKQSDEHLMIWILRDGLNVLHEHKKITGLALAILPLSPTVVGNCHCYEGTNGLKNLSSWQSNLLKPDFYYGKDCHTNTLTLFWKTK